MRRVQLLGVRGVAQELPEPGGLRSGRTEGVQQGLLAAGADALLRELLVQNPQRWLVRMFGR